MNATNRELFRAIHEGCWLYIEYHNKQEENTKYWIAVKDIDPVTKTIKADGMHMRSFEIAELRFSIERITSAKIIEGTYTDSSYDLANSIREYPEKYYSIFQGNANTRILDYLSQCNRLDQTPYKTKVTMIDHIDDDILRDNTIKLEDNQFTQLIKSFQKKTYNSNNSSFNLEMVQLGLNLLSINSKRGLYVLAYQPLRLDVKKRTLKATDNVEICREFSIEGEKQSVRQFLDDEDIYLLDDFKNNAEKIRNIISDNNLQATVDDMPYIVEIGRTPIIDLEGEYNGILSMLENKEEGTTAPIKAFFGDLTAGFQGRKSYPLILTDRMINLDQLLAMNHAMRYPLSYVQGPPGTGKTKTIMSIIVTAFFNERTVLFASNNNHPIDEVANKMKKMKYGNFTIPFPIIRLGNNEIVSESLKQVKEIYENVKGINVSEISQDKNFKERSEQARNLNKFLESYEERVDLLEKRDAIEQLLKNSPQMNFQIQLQAVQLKNVKARLNELGDFQIDDALKLIDTNTEAINAYLNYASIRNYKRIAEPKNEDFRKILYIKDEAEQVKEFNHYLSNSENLKKFISIFPIVVTTCVSAHKLAEPEPYFDMTVIDEASQCNTAVSLVPIIRGRNLLLVGDPQQLQPVIVMNPEDSRSLRKKYSVGEEYDYCKNSIYKTYLACDAVSDEVLLSHHYRCDPKIIGFNNKKYYNNKLKMNGTKKSEHP